MVDNALGVPSPVNEKPDGLLALVIAGVVGGAAPFLLRMGLYLWQGMEEAKPFAIPQASVWMGIAIFGILGLGVAFIFAGRERRQYFATAMMAPALITNATVGLNGSGAQGGEAPGQRSSLALIGSAYAQSSTEGGSESFPDQGTMRSIILNLRLQNVPVAASAAQLVVAVPGQEVGSQYCPIASETQCNILVPANADELTLSVNGIDESVDLPNGTNTIDVDLTGNPSIGQQLWFALGGTLKGEITGIDAAAQ